MMGNKLSRRHFFYGALFAGAIPAAGFGSTPSLTRLGYRSPNEKLNVAAIGVGGRAEMNLPNFESENIVALADPDADRAKKLFGRYERATKYADFRRLLDKEEKEIDAVVISTPDHMHAMAAVWCMERGKGVYVEKPLARTVGEVRLMTEAAAKYKVATQMGNQGYSYDGTREAAEIVWSGEIGDVTEVHAWTDRPVWPQGISEVPREEKIPGTLDWDLWLGVAASRPYSPAYVPFNWRGWFDFGSGPIGDMACHLLGPANMALLLGAPSSVECTSREGANELTFPKKCVLRYNFPARGTMPPVTVYWYDAMAGPPALPNGMEKEMSAIPPVPCCGPGGREGTAYPGAKPIDPNATRAVSTGAVMVGSKGFLATDSRGESVHLLPVEKMKDYKLPSELLTRSPGHYRDFIRACKGGDPACSNFGIAGPFSEWVLLGAIACRFEGRLQWNSAGARFTNNDEANQYLKPTYRKGWQIR